jgi:hypothetical protein
MGGAVNKIGRCELGEQDVYTREESGREPKREKENSRQSEHLE